MSDIADRMKRMKAVDAAIEEAKAEEAKAAEEVKATAETKVAEEKKAVEAKAAMDAEAGEESADDFKDLEGEDPIVVSADKVADALPYYGKAFWIVPVMLILTAAACVLGRISPISTGIFYNQIARYVYLGIGIFLCIVGVVIFWRATFESMIKTNVQMGKLVTTGIYQYTRNPQYAGVLFICTGAILICGNAYFFALPIIYWIVLTELLKRTEEFDLRHRFYDRYLTYMKNTNRIFPVKRFFT